MELRHLRDFVAVAEEGSFTRAALKIHVTQPSLTRQIKNLEEELGVQLLTRGSRGVSLTPSGQNFLISAKHILSISAESVRAAKTAGEIDRPQLRIGYLSALFCDPLAQTLAAFRQAYPQTGVNLFEMTIAEQLSALEERKLDLAFIGPAGDEFRATLQRELVATHDVFVAVCRRNPLAKKPRLALGDLEACLVVALSSKTWPGWRDWIDELFGQARLALQVLQEAEDEAAALRLVALGLGIAFVPDQIKLLHHAGVAFRPLYPSRKIRSSVAWSTQNDSEELRDYLRIVRQTACASVRQTM